MNHSLPTPAEPPADDGVDRLLRDYFQSQIPRQFPPVPVDAAGPMQLSRTSPLTRGRWVLAVCAAVVLLCFGLLLRSQTGGNPGGLVSQGLHGTADKHIDPMPKRAP